MLVVWTKVMFLPRAKRKHKLTRISILALSFIIINNALDIHKQVKTNDRCSDVSENS